MIYKTNTEKPEVNVLKMLNYTFFDIETLYTADEVGGWGNAHLMGFGLAYSYNTQTGYSYHENRASLRDILFGCNNHVVVSYNGIAFDTKIVCEPGDNFRHIDLLDMFYREHGFRVSLGQIGEAMDIKKPVGLSKNAPELIRAGQRKLVAEHCKNDVKILMHAFYEMLRDGGHLSFIAKSGKRQRLPVPISIANTQYY